MGWVEDEARNNALLFRDGPEKWRDVKTSINQAIDEYTKIYSPRGKTEVQYADCSPTTENCVRARILASLGEQDTSFEITFDPAKGIIKCNRVKTVFSLQISDTGTTKVVVIVDADREEKSAEDVSQEYLKPLFAKLPLRPPNIVL